MLEVKNIHAWRGPAHILHGVSLSVRSHEVVCLVGRNGAGKTTTMESIMGFVPVKSGQILFHGEEVTSLPVHSRSEEHTSELQSRLHLVCRLLLEKKKKVIV